MDREGDYEEYKSHNVLKEIEKEWIKAYRTETIHSFESSPDNADTLLRLFDTIEVPVDTNLLEQVSELVDNSRDRMDSFGKLLYAEQLQELIERTPEIRGECQPVIQKAVSLLDEVIQAPLNIGTYYSSLDYVQDILDKDTITGRAKECRYYLTE